MRAALLIALAALSLPEPAHAAWVAVTSVTTNQSKATDTTLTQTIPSGNSHVAGSVTVMCWAGDNTASSDGNDQLLTSVSDSQNNPWTLPLCYTNARTGAGLGVTVCMSWGYMVRALGATVGTITATYGSIDAKAFITKNFTIAADNYPNSVGAVGVANAQEATTAADPGALDMTLASQSHLWVRCTGLERTAAGTWTATSGFTSMSSPSCVGTTTGVANTNIDVCGEYYIRNVTTNSSNPGGTAVDTASIYWALDEATAKPRQTRQWRLGRFLNWLLVSPAQAMEIR